MIHGQVITMLKKVKILPQFTFVNKKEVSVAVVFNKYIKMKYGQQSRVKWCDERITKIVKIGFSPFPGFFPFKRGKNMGFSPSKGGKTWFLPVFPSWRGKKVWEVFTCQPWLPQGRISLIRSYKVILFTLRSYIFSSIQ